ncbi:CoA-binding protein [Nonomuraea thailandensis]
MWERLELGEFELNPVIAGPSGAIAVDARHLPAAPAVRVAELPPETSAAGPSPEAAGRAGGFLALFEPKAVAVVGASTSRPNFGNMFLGFYRDAGVPLVAVHPTAAEVAGVPAVPSLAHADVDYALVAVPAERCAEVVREARGVPFTQVMSGGFGEAGRQELERELAGAARAAGTRLLGPNCMGVYCPRGRQTFVGGGMGPAGTVALISQSGGLAGEVIKVGERRGLAFSRVVTVGNAADVTPAELLRWLAQDAQTRAIGMYLEDPRDGRELYEALRTAGKPVVLLVGGRSGQGQRAAASHTGGLVSDRRIWEAVAEQTGATLVSGQDDLIGVLAYFQAHGSRPPAGSRCWWWGRAGVRVCWPRTRSTGRGAARPAAGRPPGRAARARGGGDGQPAGGAGGAAGQGRARDRRDRRARGAVPGRGGARERAGLLHVRDRPRAPVRLHARAGSRPGRAPRRADHPGHQERRVRPRGRRGRGRPDRGGGGDPRLPHHGGGRRGRRGRRTAWGCLTARWR